MPSLITAGLPWLLAASSGKSPVSLPPETWPSLTATESPASSVSLLWLLRSLEGGLWRCTTCHLGSVRASWFVFYSAYLFSNVSGL